MKKELTSGSVLKNIIYFSLPYLLSYFLQTLYGMADLFIIGQFNGDEITKLELPIQNNPLQLINEVKICIVNWFELHKDDMEYEGCRNILSGFLETVHRYIYLFRLCKLECK